MDKKFLIWRGFNLAMDKKFLIWSPQPEQILKCFHEIGNAFDIFAIKVCKTLQAIFLHISFVRLPRKKCVCKQKVEFLMVLIWR